MKKFFIALLIICILLFGGCRFLILEEHPTEQQSVTINNVCYKNGFYGSLFARDRASVNEASPIEANNYVEVDNRPFYHIPHEMFDMYYSTNTIGYLYCNQAQWEDAKNYYGNDENYSFYCSIEAENSRVHKIENTDVEKFNDLLKFIEENSYDPLHPNKKVDKIEMEMPDKTKTPEIHFFKRSNDNLITSGTGDILHIINEKMYLVYYYDLNFGNNEKMIAVQVPEDLSRYFIDIINRFI